jgi:hypothetical protein
VLAALRFSVYSKVSAVAIYSSSTAASHFVLPSGRETHFMLPFKLLYRRRPEVEHNNNNNNNEQKKKKNWETTAACLLLWFFLSLIFFWVEKPVLQEREND